MCYAWKIGKNAYSDQVGNPYESENLQDLKMDGRIIKTVKKQVGRCGHLVHNMDHQRAHFSSVNEPSVSINYEELIKKLSTYQLPKKDCVLGSSSYSLVTPCRLVYLFHPFKTNAFYETSFTMHCPSDGSTEPQITGSNKNVQIWQANIVFLLIRNSTRIDRSIILLTECSVNSIKAR